MKKICYVDEDGRFGGPQQRMLTVANELKNRGYTIDFLIPKDEIDIFKQKLIKNNFNFYQVNLTRLSLKPLFLIRYIVLFFYEIYLLIIFFKKKKYDIIQANSTPQFKAIIVCIILKLNSVWVIEDSYFPKIIVFLFRLFARISNCKIIYTSERVYNFYFKDKSILKNYKVEIFAPINTFKFDKNIEFSKPKYLLNNKIVITTVSSIVPVKGVEYFLKAAEILYNKNNDLEFIIAGSSISSQKKYYSKIKKIIEEKKYIKHIGMCDDVPQLLANSDIFVCTSISEAGPMTVYEAMLMQLPVVTTDVGACNQIIKNYVNGIIVPIKMPEKIAEAVEKLINDKKLRNTIGKNAHDFAKDFFSLEKIIRQYTDLYNKF
jgi:glycosyltransferase involved in cell wall biosynthesis